MSSGAEECGVWPRWSTWPVSARYFYPSCRRSIAGFFLPLSVVERSNFQVLSVKALSLVDERVSRAVRKVSPRHILPVCLSVLSKVTFCRTAMPEHRQGHMTAGARLEAALTPTDGLDRSLQQVAARRKANIVSIQHKRQVLPFH